MKHLSTQNDGQRACWFVRLFVCFDNRVSGRFVRYELHNWWDKISLFWYVPCCVSQLWRISISNWISGLTRLVYEFMIWLEWLSIQNLSPIYYLSLKFVVKWVTSLNSLMSTDSLACDQNRTARTCSRLRTASLHLGVEVIAPVYCQPEDAQWKHMARSCLHHLLQNLHRANQHDKALALLCVWCSIF